MKYSKEKIQELEEALTPKARQFCREYLIDFNASQAAIRAGYSKKTAGVTGHDMLKKPKTGEYLRYLQDQRAQRTEITADRVVEEIAKIAFHNIQDLLDYFEGEVLFKDIDKMKFPEIIKSITIKEGTRNGVRIGQIAKIEVYDKVKALELLGRHTAAFTENINLTSNGGDLPTPEHNVNIYINHRAPGAPLT